MSTPVLSLDNVSVAYANGDVILQNISYRSPPMHNNVGACIALIGPNAAGKTTLLRAITARLPLQSGVIRLYGKDNNPTTVAELVAYIPQHHAIDASFPICPLDIALMGMYRRIGFGRRIKEHHKQQAMHALNLVNMHHHAHKPFGTLSGGQRQRCFIARALVSTAKLYLLDEPFTAIDTSGQELIFALFDRLCAEGKTILCVHHHIDKLHRHFSHALLLNKTCLAAGKTEDVCQKELLARAYLPC